MASINNLASPHQINSRYRGNTNNGSNTTTTNQRQQRMASNISMNFITLNSNQGGASDLWRLLKESPLRSLVGLTILIAAVALLVWNEGDAVRTSRSLDEGFDMVVSLPSADVINPENDGKIIHITGTLGTSPPLTDYRYNVELEAVRLKRRVQMYQWLEEEDTYDSEPSPLNRESSPDVSYSYSLGWRDKLVDSRLFNIPFGHENPDSFPLESEVQTSSMVRLGAYLLTAPIVETFTTYHPFSADEEPREGEVKLHAGMYYLTRDIFNPRVGDMRVQFYYSGHSGDTFSLIGEQQRGGSIGPYRSSSGQSLVLLQGGQRSPQEVFATHQSHTRLRCWVTRILGFCGLTVAVGVMHGWVRRAVLQVRVLRDVSAMSGGHFTVSVAMSLSLAVIALSWCVYRPALALLLLALAVLPAVRSGYRG